MPFSDFVSPASELELTKCRLVKRIGAQPIDATDRAHSLESALWSLDLRERHSSVQFHHGRRPNPRQNIVERDDLAPRGVLDSACALLRALGEARSRSRTVVPKGAASSRPLLGTKVPGTREVFLDEVRYPDPAKLTCGSGRGAACRDEAVEA